MKKTILVALLASLGLLSSCGKTAPVSSSSSAESSTSTALPAPASSSSSASTSSSSSVAPEDPFAFPEDVTIAESRKVMHISCTGILIDLNIGSHLVAKRDYTLSVQASSGFKIQGELSFSMSEDGILSFEKISDGSYKIHALSAGGTVVTIKDENETTFYRDAINVRNKLTHEQAEDYMYNHVNVWKNLAFASNGDKYNIVFTDLLTATMSAKEGDTTYGDISLALTYVGELDDGVDRDQYEYSIVSTSKDQSNTLKPTDFCINVTGDFAYLYEKEGIIDFFSPSSL